MKRFTLLALLCVFAIQGISSQELSYEDQLSPEKAEQYYQHRFKKKRGTARGFLFTGVGLTGIGAIIINGNDGKGLETVDESAGGAVLATLGIISSLISIPFYIKAGEFKRKAKEARASMNVSLGTIRSPQRNDLGIGLTYNF